MKRAFLMLFVLTLMSAPAFARMSPWDIERTAGSIKDGRNIEDPKESAELEKKYQIMDYKDNHWDCKDRAEVAMRLAFDNGYLALFRIQNTPDPKIGHQYVELYDRKDTTLSWKILNIDFKKQERDELRQEVRRMRRGL